MCCITLVRSINETQPVSSANASSLSRVAMAMLLIVAAWWVHCRMHWKPAGWRRGRCSAGRLPSSSTHTASCSSWLNWYMRASPCLCPTTSTPAAESTCRRHSCLDQRCWYMCAKLDCKAWLVNVPLSSVLVHLFLEA